MPDAAEPPRNDVGGSRPAAPRREVRIEPLAATREDVEGMLAVEGQAFQRNAMMEFFFTRPGVTRPAPEVRVQRFLANLGTDSYIYHKAVDAADGTMLGTAAWYLAPDPHAEGENSPWGEPPAGTDRVAFGAIVGPLRRWRMHHFRALDAPYAYLQMMSVAPAAQRQGIGAALLRAGLAEIDRRGWHAYVTASPEGVGLYKKFGWEAKKQTIVNLKDYGGPDEVIDTVALVRPPAATGHAEQAQG